MAVFRGPKDEDTDRELPPVRSPDGGGEWAPFWWVTLQFLRRHRGKITGLVIGLWVGFGILKLGVLWTLFISLCAGLGYFIGKRLDDNQEGLLEFLDRVLPPGRG